MKDLLQSFYQELADEALGERPTNIWDQIAVAKVAEHAYQEGLRVGEIIGKQMARILDSLPNSKSEPPTWPA